ncbi:unnamed protein product [Closterium sp. NIES-54]
MLFLSVSPPPPSPLYLVSSPPLLSFHHPLPPLSVSAQAHAVQQAGWQVSWGWCGAIRCFPPFPPAFPHLFPHPISPQAHAVQQAGWQVSWGWCGAIRCFLFVFPDHNRIILEAPEYGKATYFFELEAGVAVRWQLQRLLAVFGAASVSRIDVITNLPLEVRMPVNLLIHSFSVDCRVYF